MDLKKCTDCGKNILKSAALCPHCGSISVSNWVFFVASAIIVFVLFLRRSC
jgi:RNA polymerase subunit RPABC4/transcription elongation factor Spt4